MSLAFLVPGALLALIALALPVLLHLARRRQPPQEIDFAALMFVEHAPRPRRRLRVRDPWLLLVRCLLLTALALALAQPLLHGLEPARAWHLVAPGVDPAALDGRAPGEWRWLAPGFPAFDDAPPAQGDTASLIRAFDAQLPASDTLHLYMPETLSDMDGARMRLGRAAQWSVLPGASAAALPAPPLRVALAEQTDARLRAALQAWNETARAGGRVELASADAPAPDIDVLFWPREEVLPDAWRRWIATGGRALTLAAAPAETQLREWSGQGVMVLDSVRVVGGVWAQLHCPALDGATRARLSPFRAPGAVAPAQDSACAHCALTPACLPEMLEPQFPQLLRSWLAPLPEPPLPVHAAQVAPTADGPPPSPPGRPLAEWLALLAAALFALERVMASRRGRS